MYVMVCTAALNSDGTCPAANSVWLSWSDLTAFDVSQLDPTMIAQAVGAGFVMMGTFFLIGQAVRAIMHLVNH